MWNLLCRDGEGFCGQGAYLAVYPDAYVWSTCPPRQWCMERRKMCAISHGYKQLTSPVGPDGNGFFENV